MKPHSKREYLRDLVVAKTQWNRRLTDEEKRLGFLGWHERGYLPHCDYPGLVQFITFRLGDSLPESRRSEWEHLLKIEDARDKRSKLEKYLDRGIGECYLGNCEIARIAEQSLLHFNTERYELLAWCIMPNHVHVLVHVWQMPMSKLIQCWKIHVTKEVHRLDLLNRNLRVDADPFRIDVPSGCSALHEFWQREYWDTFMRDEDQERKAIRYIENNPVKEKLCATAEKWQFSSARFRDQKSWKVMLPKYSQTFE